MTRSRSRSAWVLAGFVAVCLGGGVVAGLATSKSVAAWYPYLAKPSWTPKGWLFAPVWTVLYIMMAVAGWRVWRRIGLGWPHALFATQLALNIAWSFSFFAARDPVAGMVNIAALWCAIVATIVVFSRIDRVAVALLVPYLACVSFASALNAAIVHAN
ncbi:tryptophan-rich sensory protein [soil metagenome]